MDNLFVYTLPNGIRCIYYRIDSPVAYCAMTINVGSRDELSNEHGLAHFTEHSIFKGTKSRDVKQINSYLDRLGGELNAFTTKEETVVHATTLLDDFPKAAELIADILFNSTFPPCEIEKEREVIIDEINSYKDLPSEHIYDTFEDMLFSGSTLGHKILGVKKRVNSFESEDIANFVKRTYNTDQMVFSAAANIDEKEFKRVVERNFGGIEKSTRTFGRELPEKTTPFHIVQRRETHQAHCIIGSKAYSIHDKSRLPLSLLINTLGGPASNSILNMLLREENGLTYTVEASYSPYSDTGVTSIYFGTDKGKTEKCLELIDGVLKKVETKKMSTLQLEEAKRQLIGQLLISMENKESYMLNVGHSYQLYGEVDDMETICNKIRSVTQEDILRVANEIFGNRSTLIYK